MGIFIAGSGAAAISTVVVSTTVWKTVVLLYTRRCQKHAQTCRIVVVVQMSQNTPQKKKLGDQSNRWSEPWVGRLQSTTSSHISLYDFVLHGRGCNWFTCCRLTVQQVWRFVESQAFCMLFCSSLPALSCRPQAGRPVSWFRYRVPPPGPKQETCSGRVLTSDTLGVTDSVVKHSLEK